MDRLPLELLVRILQNLYPRELPEAHMVSRQWRNIIRGRVSYYNCFLDQTHDWSELSARIQAEPDTAYQTETLTIHRNIMHTVWRQSLCTYFPRLRYLYIHPGSELNVYETSVVLSDASQFERWRNQIVLIQQHVWTEKKNNLFLSGSFLGLRRLVISFGPQQQLKHNITKIYEHAPYLTSLTITNPNISLLDLKNIQNGLHFLESLFLKNVRIHFEDNPALDMVPNNVTTLFISACNRDTDRIVSWLQFVGRNYNQLQRFSFIFPFNNRYSDADEMRIMNDGWRPLIQQHRNILRYVEASFSSEMQNFLHTIAEINTGRQRPINVRQMVTFISGGEIFEGLQQIERLRLIQKLTVTVTFADLISNLRGFNLLEELHISAPPGTTSREIDLKAVLEKCPLSLITLEIYGFRVRCNDLGPGAAIPPLWKLSLKYYFIENTAFQYISDVLGRNLRSLTLISRDSNIVPILLVGLELHMLIISMTVPREIIIRTTVDHLERRYTFQDHRQRVFRDDDLVSVHPRGFVAEIPRGNELAASTMIVTCRSVREVVINNNKGVHFR